jgi:hypothetical protein
MTLAVMRGRFHAGLLKTHFKGETSHSTVLADEGRDNQVKVEVGARESYTESVDYVSTPEFTRPVRLGIIQFTVPVPRSNVDLSNSFIFRHPPIALFGHPPGPFRIDPPPVR